MRYQVFEETMIKLAQDRKKSKLRKAAEGMLAGGAAYGVGYGLGAYGIPAMTGKVPKISPSAAKVLGIISGLGLTGMYTMQRGYINDNSADSNKRSRSGSSKVQPSKRKLFVRRKGRPSEVSSRVFSPDAQKQESFSFRSGRGLANRRTDVGSDNYRQRSDEYGYARKKTRDYSFKEPVRVRKPGSR